MPQMALHSSLFARISATTQDLLQKTSRPVLQKEPSELLTPQQLAACPQEYLCPISLDIMRDPVLLLPTGQIYDFHSLTQWFASGEPLKTPLHDLQFFQIGCGQAIDACHAVIVRHCPWRQQGRKALPVPCRQGRFTHTLMQDPVNPIAVCPPCFSGSYLCRAGCRRKILPTHRNATGRHRAHAL